MIDDCVKFPWITTDLGNHSSKVTIQSIIDGKIYGEVHEFTFNLPMDTDQAFDQLNDDLPPKVMRANSKSIKLLSKVETKNSPDQYNIFQDNETIPPTSTKHVKFSMNLEVSEEEKLAGQQADDDKKLYENSQEDEDSLYQKVNSGEMSKTISRDTMSRQNVILSLIRNKSSVQENNLHEFAHK